MLETQALEQNANITLTIEMLAGTAIMKEIITSIKLY